MVSAPAKVLVVEDEPDLREMLVYHLRREGFAVSTTGRRARGAPDGTDRHPARRAARFDDRWHERPRSLPTCGRRANSRSKLRIIVVSARTDESDVLQGLALGADDYVRKPFNPREVIARLKTVLRRVPTRPAVQRDHEVLSFPPLTLDDGSHVATLADDRLSLTATEYRLLRTLMLQPERVFSRAQLMEQLGEGKGTVSGRTIDVHVRSLRKKLGSFSTAIDTARGVGYRFVPPVARTRVRGSSGVEGPWVLRSGDPDGVCGSRRR
jgi:two-component system phosphate regulon response regulator PhoB